FSPLVIGFIVGGLGGCARREARKPPWTRADLRRVFVGCGKPAESCRAKRCTDLALLDAMNGNAEHIGADLRPQRRARAAAHKIDLRDRGTGTAERREIVTRGEGHAFE